MRFKRIWNIICRIFTPPVLAPIRVSIGDYVMYCNLDSKRAPINHHGQMINYGVVVGINVKARVADVKCEDGSTYTYHVIFLNKYDMPPR